MHQVHRAVRQEPALSLFPREREALECAADGLTAEQTAQRMGISVNTAKLHRAKAIRKLGARGVANAVYLALRAGVIA